MKRLDGSVVVKVKVTGMFKISANVRLDTISSSAETFVTKLDMVMHCHGPEHHTRRLVCNQGHSEGLYSETCDDGTPWGLAMCVPERQMSSHSRGPSFRSIHHI